MKRSSLLFKPLLLLLLLVQWLSPQAQTICENFNNNSVGNWQAVAAGVGVSNIAPMADGTRYLRGTDGSGSSSIFNNSYNSGTVGCGTICFDYKVFDDGVAAQSPQVINTIRIAAVVNGQPLSAVFQLAIVITENSGWVNICAPLNQIAANAPLPGNATGSWLMTSGTAAQWNLLVNNYTQVSFATDVVGSSSPTEVIGIDNFCVTPGSCCDPNPSSLFTLQRSCVNGAIVITLTANDNFPLTNHLWSLYETSVCGNTSDANTVDANINTPAIDPVASTGGATATFTITDLNKCYYIKHGIWQINCFGWQETRTPIQPYLATNIFNFENAAGTVKTKFCYGEDIYLDGTASQGENQYFIDAWRRPIGSTGNFNYYAGLGWTSGQIGIVNLSQLFAGLGNPVYFEPGYEYSVKLALSNTPNCVGWTQLEHTFIVECCDGYLDGCFKADVKWNGNNTYNLNPVFFNTYANIGAVHEWYVLSSPNLNAGPYTPLASLTTTTQTGFTVYGAAQPGLYYYVIHKIKTACGEICTQVIQYQQTLAREKDSESQAINACAKIDCCFLNDYWPNGPGQAQPFTGEFNMTTATNGSQYSITATPVYSYSNNPGITHEWYLFSSPNPGGGPYTLVDQATGATYNYPSADNGLYYFLVHRVKSACGEKCYGRSVYHNARMAEAECDLCGEIDCALVDSLIDPCATPIDLRGDCDKNTLNWNVVAGATAYMVEISYNDPKCCKSNRHPTGAVYSVSTNYLDLGHILSPVYDCLRWRVMTRCEDGSSRWSDWLCYDCKRQGFGKQLMVKSEEPAKTIPEPVIAPNPNNGTMSLYLEAPGELKVAVEVYNTYGKLIHSLKQRSIPGGRFSETLTLPSAYKGMYTVVFKTNYGTFNKKIVVN